MNARCSPSLLQRGAGGGINHWHEGNGAAAHLIGVANVG